MKKINVLYIMLLISVNSFAAQHTITNSGLTFTPDNIAISFGDTVIFSIASMHNVIEVSQATWNANGNIPLSGGFSLPSGGGTLYNITNGIHYYVCGPHASLGMKGIINVNNSGINEINSSEQINLRIFPNPVKGNILNINYTIIDNTPGIIQLVDISGTTIYSDKIGSNIGDNAITIDLSALKPGFYFMILNQGKKSYAEKIVKM